MKILFVSSDSNQYSGAFLSMVKLVSLLQKEHQHQILVVLPSEGSGTEMLRQEGIRYKIIKSYDWTVGIDSPRTWKKELKTLAKTVITNVNVLVLARLIRTEQIDLVHVNTSWTYIGAKAALMTGRPLIWHIREFLEEDQNRKIRNREKGYRLMAKANHLVAISHSIAKKYAPIVGEEKISVIYNGINPLPFLNQKHEIMKNDVLNFLMVGGLLPQKGQWQAIQACVKLHALTNQRFVLRLVGKGNHEYTEELRTMIDQNQASEYIQLCGVSSDTASYYKEADIVFMCSDAEAFGRVTVEGMLAGALVIGANSAGTGELIHDGETGILYRAKDVESLVDKLNYALMNRSYSQQIAKNGQEYALHHLTAQINAQNINKLYLNVMETNSIHQE